MPPKVPAGAAAAAAAEDDSSSSSDDEKGEAGAQSKQSKLERKSRKAVAKLGLKPITGVLRVTLRRQKSYQVFFCFTAYFLVRPSLRLVIPLTSSFSSSSLPPTSINHPSATRM
jgi:hypothetical protein